MKKLFIYLLKKYSRNEAGRLEIQKILHEQLVAEYYEQTPYGNIYNSHIEFIMANPFVNQLMNEDRTADLGMVKRGLANAYDASLEYLKK